MKKKLARPKKEKEPKVRKRAPIKVHPLPLGRPLKYDLKAEAKELLEWCKLPTSTSLYEFTRNKDYLAQELSTFATTEPDFSLALIKAKEQIGINREIACNSSEMNYGVWNRWAGLYHKDLENFEDQKEEKKLERSMRLAKYQEDLKAQSSLALAKSPHQDKIDSDDENMLLKAEMAVMRAKMIVAGIE
jgi:hypothetical protein